MNRQTRTIIKQAADALYSEGIHPTVENIQEKTRQKNTRVINAALEEWWNDMAVKLASDDARPGTPEPVVKLANDIWNNALKEAHVVLSQYRQEADTIVAQVESKIETMSVENEDAQNQIYDLHHSMEQLEDKVRDLDHLLTTESTNRTSNEQKIQELEKELDHHALDIKQRTTLFELQLEREQDQNDSVERRLSALLSGQKSVHSKMEKELNENRSNWKKKELDLQNQISKLHTREAQLKGQMSAVQEKQNIQSKQFHKLQKEKDSLLKERANINVRNEKLRDEMKMLKAECLNRQQQYHHAVKEKDQLYSSLKRTEAKLSTAEAEIRSLQSLLSQYSPSLLKSKVIKKFNKSGLF